MQQKIEISKEDIKIALHWMKGEIGLIDASRHYEVFNMSAYHRLAMCLRQAYKDKKLTIK